MGCGEKFRCANFAGVFRNACAKADLQLPVTWRTNTTVYGRVSYILSLCMLAVAESPERGSKSHPIPSCNSNFEMHIFDMRVFANFISSFPLVPMFAVLACCGFHFSHRHVLFLCVSHNQISQLAVGEGPESGLKSEFIPILRSPWCGFDNASHSHIGIPFLRYTFSHGAFCDSHVFISTSSHVCGSCMLISSFPASPSFFLVVLITRFPVGGGRKSGSEPIPISRFPLCWCDNASQSHIGIPILFEIHIFT